MKKGFNILLSAIVLLVVFSCNNNSMKSYREMLKDERKAIDRLKDEEGLVFLKEYPANKVFEENEFFKLDEGIYMNVIDSGTGNRAVVGDEVLCRYEVYIFMTDSFRYDYFMTPYNAVGFKYLTSYNTTATGVGDPSYFLSSAVGVPLNYVSDSAEVKIIVPFNVGTSFQSDYGEPLYYTRIKYIIPKYMQ